MARRGRVTAWLLERAERLYQESESVEVANALCSAVIHLAADMAADESLWEASAHDGMADLVVEYEVNASRRVRVVREGGDALGWFIECRTIPGFANNTGYFNVHRMQWVDSGKVEHTTTGMNHYRFMDPDKAAVVARDAICWLGSAAQ